MKKILFIVPSMRGGGVEKVLLNMLSLMDQSKYSITVMAIMSGGERIDEFPVGIKYRYIWKRDYKIFGRRIKGTDRLFNFLFSKLSARSLYRIFVRKVYDTVVDYWGQEGLKLACGSGKKAKKLTFIHSDVNNDSMKKAFFPYRCNDELRKAYLYMDNVVCVSKDSRNGFIDRFDLIDNEQEKVIVRYNINLVEQIKEKAKEEIQISMPKNKLLLCTSGRLTEAKGFERLIDICGDLKKEGLDFVLWILGNGELQQQLENKIIDNSLENTVFMMGYQSNPYKYMSKSDIFVCSSYVEGFSTVVSEAVILGLPIVSTDCTGAREILGDSEFGMVTDKDNEALKNGLKTMICDTDTREKYRNRVNERSELFDQYTRLREVEELF